jgi:predicted RNase H-like nuclease
MKKQRYRRRRVTASIAGVDGCPAGWVAVIERFGAPICASIFVRFEDLLKGLSDVGVIAVDIPIGLPERGARDCDVEARRRLGVRGSSVFPAPLRAILNSSSREEASRIRYEIEGKLMSCQAFGIVKKVREVDRTLLANRAARRRVVEVHPELSFAAWRGRPMRHPKGKKAGRSERQRLISGVWPEDVERCEMLFARSKCGLDDLYDAFAALWSARRVASGVAEQLPEIAPRDARGLPMRIIA